MNKIFALGIVIVFSQNSSAQDLVKLSRFKETFHEYNLDNIKNNDWDDVTEKSITQIIPDKCNRRYKGEDSVVVDGEIIYCKKVKMKSITMKEFSVIQTLNKQNPLKQAIEENVDELLNSIFMDIDKLIAVGEKVISIIDAGKPVVTNKPLIVSVLPKTNDKDFAFSEMTNWSLPKTALFKVAYRNGWGSEVVTFNYSVSFQYNGNYNGKGKYLHGIRVTAKNINVSWGFDLSANSELLAISNIGSKENPVAAATVEINYTIKNQLKSISTAESFFMDGQGNLYKLD